MKLLYTLALLICLVLCALVTGIHNEVDAAPTIECQRTYPCQSVAAIERAEPHRKPQERVVEPAPKKEKRVSSKGRWVYVKVTAYTPWDAIDSHSGYQDGYTSIMVNTKSVNPNKIYGIAADPRAIPYGTKVYVPGYWESIKNNKNTVPTEMVIIDDTGGALRRSYDNGVIHIDVRYRTGHAARKWGVKWMKVFVYN